MSGKIIVCLALAVASVSLSAQTLRRSMRSSGEAKEDMRVVIDQFPKIGRQATLNAPNFSGESTIGRAFPRPRKWIVLEAKYSTFASWYEQLNFTWHVLLETRSATAKAREVKMAPYSYFTTTVSYKNIPRGVHAASVCLHPSNLERYGEPKVVGLVITDKDGKVLAGDSLSEVRGIKSNTEFWKESSIMEAKNKEGDLLIEPRQGLLDRSKTIWALVNSNDYEQTVE
jgi:hypothetical protein